MTEQEDDQIENHADLVKEEILNTLHSLDTIMERVNDVTITRRTFGKTIDQWCTELTLKLDPQADPAKVKYYLSILSANLDTASRNLSKTKVMYGQYKLSYIPALAGEIYSQANHKARKVSPAIDTMMKVAEHVLSNRAVAVTEFETFIDFWLDMVYKIRNQVDIVKTISMANGTLYRVGEY